MSSPSSVSHPAPKSIRGLGVILTLIGVVTFIYLLLTGHEQRAWSGALQGMVLPTWIAIGALFFIAIHRITGAVWTTSLRRLFESMTTTIFVTAAAALAIVFCGAPYLYDWVYNREGLFHDHGHGAGITKAEWMQHSRWTITTGIIILLWIAFRHRLVSLSRRQDRGADITAAHMQTSVLLLLVLAPTFTLFVWDMLLSLHVTFASAMWGVYCFTGAVQTFLAVLVLLVLVLRSGPLADIVKEHTLHDLGTWTLAWGVFCGYIGFAQYLVIYYANLDEEVAWFLPRLQHGYGTAYAVEAVLRCCVPFLLLISQSTRTKAPALVLAAIAVMVGNWMDWSWIIAPAFSPNEYRPFWALPEVAIGLGFAGLSLLAISGFWKRHGYVVTNDPHLHASIHGEHLHS